MGTAFANINLLALLAGFEAGGSDINDTADRRNMPNEVLRSAPTDDRDMSGAEVTLVSAGIRRCSSPSSITRLPRARVGSLSSEGLDPIE